MPVEQLAQPCWYTRYPGGEHYQNDCHYETQAVAERAAEKITEEQPGAVIEQSQWDGRCWVVTCDGECGDQPEDDDSGRNVHCESRLDAEKFAESCGWIVTRDGQVFCGDDAPEYARADLVVTEQIPGQEALPGVGKAANA